MTPAQLAALAPLCDAEVLAPALSAAAADSGIDTPQRLAHWLGQLDVESGGFTKFTEALGYSAERLCAVWPSRFPTLAAARPFAHNPQALANKVYDNRLGNTEPDDGWKFRGRGLIQITGRENYHRYGQLLDLDLIDRPDLAELPVNAARIAGAFWSAHGLNGLADRDDVEAITRAINGGLTGLADRRAAVARAKAVLGIHQT
jgi:putative chitinase